MFSSFSVSRWIFTRLTRLILRNQCSKLLRNIHELDILQHLQDWGSTSLEIGTTKNCVDVSRRFAALALKQYHSRINAAFSLVVLILSARSCAREFIGKGYNEENLRFRITFHEGSRVFIDLKYQLRQHVLQSPRCKWVFCFVLQCVVPLTSSFFRHTLVLTSSFSGWVDRVNARVHLYSGIYSTVHHGSLDKHPFNLWTSIDILFCSSCFHASEDGSRNHVNAISVGV